MTPDDRHCVYTLMCQFRDAKQDGLAASRRVNEMVGLIDYMIEKERERAAKLPGTITLIPTGYVDPKP